VITLRCKTITEFRLMNLGLPSIFEPQIRVKLESFVRHAVNGRH
jgi:hypothetical protein